MVAGWKLSSTQEFDSNNYWTTGAKHVNFGMEISHKYTYKLRKNCKLTIKNMATVWNFGVISDETKSVFK
jgi:hypothetical protein